MWPADRKENGHQIKLFLNLNIDETDNQDHRLKVHHWDKELRKELLRVPENYCDVSGIEKICFVKAQHNNYFWVYFEYELCVVF